MLNEHCLFMGILKKIQILNESKKLKAHRESTIGNLCLFVIFLHSKLIVFCSLISCRKLWLSFYSVFKCVDERSRSLKRIPNEECEIYFCFWNGFLFLLKSEQPKEKLSCVKELTDRQASQWSEMVGCCGLTCSHARDRFLCVTWDCGNKIHATDRKSIDASLSELYYSYKKIS